MLSTKRVFDIEDTRTLEALRETAEGVQISFTPLRFARTSFIEQDSRSADALQAADVAAGVARETIDREGLRALANKFRRVFINGINLHDALR